MRSVVVDESIDEVAIFQQSASFPLNDQHVEFVELDLEPIELGDVTDESKMSSNTDNDVLDAVFPIF